MHANGGVAIHRKNRKSESYASKYMQTKRKLADNSIGTSPYHDKQRVIGKKSAENPYAM